MSTTYPFHEAANIFPLDEEHIGELAEDLRVNGQQVRPHHHPKGRGQWIADDGGDDSYVD